jgi:hypothetical protein
VICPHCGKNLLRRQRSGQKCAYCRREFALDPKTNALGLHDLRVRKLADKLGTGGLRYTETQLRYAASRKKIDEPVKPLQGCGCAVFIPVTIGTIVLIAVAQPSGAGAGAIVITALAIGIGLNILFAALRPGMARRRSIGPPVTESGFGDLVRRWTRIYHQPPPGMIVGHQPSVVPKPAVALVCPDPSVLDCLDANGVARRLGMALVRAPAAAPPGVPVILLHDASWDGLRFAAAARAALPGRTVVDGGLRPLTPLRHKGVLRLRDHEILRAELRGLPLTEAEAAWLADGWWAPVGAVPPARLISMVERAVGRLDPDRARAEKVGFLTWPD